MSGHSRWERGDYPTNHFMVQYVQGYILAMEDMLRDIDSLQYGAEDADWEYQSGHAAALESLKFRAEESRDSARRTLDVLVAKLDKGSQ